MSNSFVVAGTAVERPARTFMARISDRMHRALEAWAANAAVAKQQQEHKRALALRQQQEEQAYKERCEREAVYRRIAITAAIKQAQLIVDQMGITEKWISDPFGSSFFGVWTYSNIDTSTPQGQSQALQAEHEMRARRQYRVGLIEKYTAQILGNQHSPIEQLRQQNAYGDAGFANALALQHARGNHPPLPVNQVVYRD